MRKFRLPLIPAIAALLLFALLVRLGIWQLDRAAEKEEIQREVERRGRAPAVDLAAPGAAREDEAELRWRHVLLRGRYDPVMHILLDNQVYRGRAGYFVYTPFLLAGESVRVLVNRGWVAAGNDRSSAPAVVTPGGDIAIEGVARPLPRTPVLKETPPEVLAPGVLRVQEVRPALIAEREGWTLLPYEVRLEEPAPGFVRDLPAPGIGRERHLAYAFQWFSLATLLAVICAVLIARSARHGGKDA
jgi:surfeit locus 1 family protein